VSTQKREGEGRLKWGQQWRMGGSYREAAEVMSLGWEPKRREGVSGGGSRRGEHVGGGEGGE
jgi:hypothetical protein